MKLSYGSLFGAVLLACCVSILGSSRAVRAEEKGPAAQLADLNKKALAQLQARHFDAAKEILLEALVQGKDAGLGGSPEMIRTYVELAALYISGEKNRDKAANQLVQALRIDPTFTLPSDLETPALKSAYLLARRQAGVDASTEVKPVTKATPAPAPVVQPPSTDEPRQADQGEPATITKRGRGGHKVTVDIADPDLPARVPSALFCPLPFEIPPGQDMVVRCLTQKQQKKSSATLYYRTESASSEDFTAVPMTRSPKGWLQAAIPADAIKDKSLSYYIEARVPSRDGGDQILNLGRVDAPNSFLVKEGADSSFKSDRENILDTLNTTIADEEDTFHYHRRPAGALWFSVAGGTAGAYHGTETVDTGDTSGGTPVRSLSGFTGAGLFQLEPEVGYQWTKRLSLSAMLRVQDAPPNSSGYTGKAIRQWAVAGFLRGRYAFLTAGNFQANASAGAGGGTSFLVVVNKQCDANNPTAGCRLTHSDTLHGGPVGVLLGIGATYHLSRNFAVYLDVNEIGTLPKFMALTEASLGLAFAIDLAGSAPAATDEGVVNDKPGETEESSEPSSAGE